MPFIVYILYSFKIDRFYVGQTSNLEGRIAQYNSSEESYTSWTLLWSVQKHSPRTAEDLEFKLKNLTRIRNIKFMRKYREGIRP